jgi:hypothetical protein
MLRILVSVLLAAQEPLAATPRGIAGCMSVADLSGELL